MQRGPMAIHMHVAIWLDILETCLVHVDIRLLYSVTNYTTYSAVSRLGEHVCGLNMQTYVYAHGYFALSWTCESNKHTC